MTPKEKIKAYFTTQSKKLPPYGSTWEEWHDRAERTEKIDYGCKFKDGTCIVARRNPHDTLTKVGCCCTHCREYKGYLYTLNPEHLETYISLWNCRTGFYRKNVGCVLPRKLRSPTCLGYNCGSRELNNKIQKLLQKGV